MSKKEDLINSIMETISDMAGNETFVAICAIKSEDGVHSSIYQNGVNLDVNTSMSFMIQKQMEESALFAAAISAAVGAYYNIETMKFIDFINKNKKDKLN